MKKILVAVLIAAFQPFDELAAYASPLLF